MRKYLIVFILFISGCSVSGTSLEQQIDASVAFVSSQPAVELRNNRLPLYSYYLPRNIGKRSSNQLAATFVSYNEEVVLSLDIASIIMNRFYRIQLAGQLRPLYGKQNALIAKKVSLNDINGASIDYRIVILPFSEDRYMVYVQSQEFLASAMLPLSKVQPVLTDMLIVLRSAQAQSNDIINLFSNKIVIDYDRISKELIEFIAPESGTIVDMLKLITGDFDFDETLPDDYYDDDVIEIPDEEPKEEGDEDVEGE
ncbi:MAG: hypothetical protein Q8S15_08705 [Erysipelotrichaceae bacterium]|nr:hypothetical protein [Erysipelotrichaceae bacterium]